MIESSPFKDSFYVARNAFDKVAAQKQKAVIDFSQALHANDKQQLDVKGQQLQTLQRTSEINVAKAEEHVISVYPNPNSNPSPKNPTR